MEKETGEKIKRDVRVILHDIRSTHNVGSMFRTSDAGGVLKIYLSGYTPTPIDQFGRKRKDIAKTALGAEESVPWEYSTDIKETIKELKKEGFVIIAVEQSKHSVDYRTVHVGQKVVLLMGNEVLGVSEELLKQVDCITEIPMKGDKESLNVSVAFGIVLFSMIK